MAGYRFANPNYTSAGGTIGDALNRAAGSVDNIAIAMLRSAKTPEERAMMAAHQNAYDATARKATAEAGLLEQQQAIAADPMGTIATAMLGPSGRAKVAEAQNFDNGLIEGPIQPQVSAVMPQLRRDARTLTLARGSGDKNIGDIMKMVMQQGAQEDVAVGRVTPQDMAVRQYVSGASPNRPYDIDNGGLKLSLGSGTVDETPISKAEVLAKKATANRDNAAAGRENAHAGLYNAQKDNEIAGLPGRSGGRGGKGAETEKQRIDREAFNEETLRARDRIRTLTRDDVNNAPKGSPTALDYQRAIRPLKMNAGESDTGYDEFMKTWGEPPKETVAAAMQRVVQMADEPGSLNGLFGKKYADNTQGNKAIGAVIRKEFGLSPTDTDKIIQQARLGGTTPAASAPTPAKPAQAVGPKAPAVPDLNTWMAAAKKSNPNASDQELKDFYAKKYQGAN